MNIRIIKSEKNEIRAELGNLTVAEILRVYLNKDPSVSFAAWRRKHPSEKPIILVRTKGKTAKKAISDAVDAISKDLDKFEKNFKGLR